MLSISSLLLSVLTDRFRSAEVHTTYAERYYWHIHKPCFHFEHRLLNLKESFCAFLLSQIQMSLALTLQLVFERTILKELLGQKAISLTDQQL